MTQSRPVRSTGSSGSSRSTRTSPTTFYRQVVAELRKVVWPSQQQLITYFLVVLVFVVVVMTIVSLLDLPTVIDLDEAIARMQQEYAAIDQRLETERQQAAQRVAG